MNGKQKFLIGTIFGAALAAVGVALADRPPLREKLAKSIDDSNKRIRAKKQSSNADLD
ncbi:MAG: hypothetical protein NWF08_02515 [Candidatus Bathyarchaeota archaeon]|nr:hypothetical protein [Candidatus Bathyarchaeota archaeon]